MYRPDSFYFFVDLGDYRQRNLPTYVYQQHLAEPTVTDVFVETDPLSQAYAAFSSGRYYEAMVNFDLAIEADPDNGLLYLARAQTRIAIKDYRLAYEDLIKGMELVPEWADVDFNISEIYSNTSDLEQHASDLETWVNRYPSDPKARFVLGYFYYFLQDYSAAKDELVQYLAQDAEQEHAIALMDRILEVETEQEIATREQEIATREQEPAESDTPVITTE